MRIDDWAFGLFDTKKKTFLIFVLSSRGVSSVGHRTISTVTNREMTETECLSSFTCELFLRGRDFCATTIHMYYRYYEYNEKFYPADSWENANFGNGVLHRATTLNLSY